MKASEKRQSSLGFKFDGDVMVDDQAFVHSLSHLLNAPTVEGNHVDILVNGVEIFPAMLEAIGQAEHTITFETFIYWNGRIAKEFADALADRARQGVSVHVILDGYGATKANDELLDIMRDAGCHVNFYNPIEFKKFFTSGSLNRRTHRKIMVIDGRIGFIGGVGIADEWDGDARNPNEWHDTHFRVAGPVVNQLQGIFLDNWIHVKREVFLSEHYFPEIEPAGNLKAHVFKSIPRAHTSNTKILCLNAFHSAKKEILITTPYLLPDKDTRQILFDAVDRGVDVKIIVPGSKVDHKVVRNSSRYHWKEYLEAGVELYRYDPTFIHAKTLIVDSYWTSVGSSNMDFRSLCLNDECNLNVFDYEFSAKMKTLFEQDLEKSTRVTQDYLDSITWQNKVGDFLAYYFLRKQL